ncbi:thioredoxin [Candidatus Shapirobacteria bacterium]|nr:thioredoxin [Candidatus Shapirobacteria bacterium]
MSNPINVGGNDSFKAEVLGSELPVLVDFWAPWCGPCQMMAPVLEELAKEMEGKLKVVKLDTDLPENQQLAIDYNIRSIPNLKIFQSGKVVKDLVGYRPKDVLVTELAEFAK